MIQQSFSTTTHHLPGIRIFVVYNGVLERAEEVFLEAEMRQLFLLQKVHRQLPKRIERKEADIGVIMTAHLLEVSARYNVDYTA